MESQKQVLERLRGAFRSGVTRPIQFRLTQLEAMMSLFEDNETLILEAMHKDLAKVKNALVHTQVLLNSTHK